MGSSWNSIWCNHMLGYAISTSNRKMYSSIRSKDSTFSYTSTWPRVGVSSCTRYVFDNVSFILVPDLIIDGWNGNELYFIWNILGNNEVGLWNLESRFRQRVLWASSSPILSTTHSSPHSVSDIYAIQAPNSQGYVMTNVLTAGTDMRIRFWDLETPNNSTIVSHGATEMIDRSSVAYK